MSRNLKSIYLVCLVLFTNVALNAQIGKALVLDGFTDFFEVPDSDLLDYDQAMSIEAWISPNCGSGNKIVFSKQWCEGQYGYYLSVNNGRLYWSYTTTGYCTSPNFFRTVGTPMVVDEFIHVAVVHGQSEIKLFVNGVEALSEFEIGTFLPILNSSEPFRIGAYKNSDETFANYFSGMVDEVRFWNIELTEALIQQRMNTPLVGNENGLVFYYDMEENGVSTPIVLDNKSITGAQFDAQPAGFSDYSPFLIDYELYGIDVLDLGEDILECTDTSTLSTGIYHYYDVSWSTGDTEETIPVTGTGLYSVVVEKELCEFYNDNIFVEFSTPTLISNEYFICEGEVFTITNELYLEDSIVYDTISSSFVCDTIHEYIVNIIPPITSELALTACEGDPVIYNGLELLPNTVTEVALSSYQGCDSIVTVTVSTGQITGDDVMLSSCEGNPVNYNGYELFPNTVTEVVLASYQGCDSVVMVSVNPYEVPGSDVLLSTCEDNPVYYNGIELFSNTVTEVILSNYQGCDSVVTVTVTSNEVNGSEVFLSACEGTSVTYNGTELFTNTATVFILPSYQGCDSVVMVTVNPYDVIGTELSLSACEGNSIFYNGIELFPNTVTEVILPSYQSCDSVVTVTVTPNEVMGSELSFFACEGGSVIYEGTELFPNTVTEFVFPTSQDCDSIVTVTVTAYEIMGSEVLFSACEGGTVFYDGTELQTNTTTEFIHSSYQGCDSVVTVMVSAFEVTGSEMSLTACEGQTVTYNGTELQTNTITEFVFTSYQNCDSIVTVSVSPIQIDGGEVLLSACSESPAYYNGTAFYPNTTTAVILPSYQGCDSVVTVSVALGQVVGGEVFLTACEGEPVYYNNAPYYANTITEAIFQSYQGCDSIVTVTVVPYEVPEGEVYISTCIGRSVYYYGNELESNSTTEVVLSSYQGCDSIVTVHVDAVVKYENFLGEDRLACGKVYTLFSPGDSTLWDDGTVAESYDITKSGTYHAVYVDPMGCVGKDTINIEFGEGQYYVPNSFSPNSDGNNDCFRAYFPENTVLEEYRFSVYNRWGGLVFETSDPLECWEGDFNGNRLDVGVLVYRISGYSVNCEEWIHREGEINLLR